MSLQRYQESVRIDADGNEIEPIPGQVGWYVRKATIGRPGAILRNGQPLTIPPNATIAELQQLLDGWWGVVRLYPFDLDGEVMEDAPVAVIHLEPDLSSQKPEHSHWMRLDRVFDMCDRFMDTIQTKDMILARVTEALLDSHRELQTGAAELLRTANTTINVATGIERSELNLDALCERVVEAMDERQSEPARAPWFVQLADTHLGKGVVELATGFVSGIARRYGKPETSS